MTWKPAKHDDLIDIFLKDPNYDARPDGTIWSTNRFKQPTRLIGKDNINGYYSVDYKDTRNSQYKSLLHQRIVYAKYCGKLDSMMVVNHIDEDKLNNHPANLELRTPRENANLRSGNKRKVVAAKATRIRSPKVVAALEAIINDPLYIIKEDGTVWTYKSLYGRKINEDLRQVDSKPMRSGYKRISYNGGDLYLHHVIYRKFHGELIDGLEVDHIDTEPGNNRADNLQQIAPSRNAQKRLTTKLTEDQIPVIKEKYNNGISWLDLALEYVVAVGTIQAIIENRSWH